MVTQTKSVVRAVAKYDKTNTQGLYIKLHKVKDKDIIDKLETVDSKQGYIKKLIREDIVNNKVGRWIVSTVETLDGQGLYECSICKHTEFYNDYNFCPNCGSKMTND